MPKKPTLFLDRDGTINEYGEYIYKKRDFHFRTGIIEIIRKFNTAGWYIIVITNQAGIARGFYSEDDVKELHKWVDSELEKENTHIDAWYYCPHHPTEGQTKYTRICACRKPGTGMIVNACNDFDIDMHLSILVGDSQSDIECGQRMGLSSFFIWEFEKHIDTGLSI